MTTHTLDPPSYLLDRHIDEFQEYLRNAGYAERTIRQRRSAAIRFAAWMRTEKVALENLADSHVTAFVNQSPRGRCTLACMKATLRSLLRWLHLNGMCPAPSGSNDSSPAEDLTRRYAAFLRDNCGLAENSLRVYLPHVRNFLWSRVACGEDVCPATYDTPSIQTYLVEATMEHSALYSRLLAASLRSFFRFLFINGETACDLSCAVPSIRKWRLFAPPAFLSPEEVERVISTADCSTHRGCRDRAVLLLLARLAMRAGEVVGLELDDIRWRAGEIVVHGKGSAVDCLPLVSDVGEALATYIRTARATVVSRKVFLRLKAPQQPLAGPAAVCHIVRLALARAGIQRTTRCLSHLFRHSLGTRMIRSGASLQEIAEVLRHRSQATTGIYAHVSFEALREVARPWPGLGGA